MRDSLTRAAAAIDIGTTNVQASLVDLDTGGGIVFYDIY